MSAALLSFARMLLEQADIMQKHFGVGNKRVPKFCVSRQYYSFAVNAFVEVVKECDADRYGFILRETQTGSVSRSNELKPYPYLIFEQGDRNSFIFPRNCSACSTCRKPFRSATAQHCSVW